MAQVTRKNGYYYCKEDDKFYPSVTTVKSNFGNPAGLLKYYAKEGGRAVFHHLATASKEFLHEALQNPNAMEWALDTAAASASQASRYSTDVGNEVHKVCEAYLKNEGMFDSNNIVVSTSLETFKTFVEGSKLKFVDAEYEVFNPDPGYAGRVDMDFKITTLKALTPFISGKKLPDKKGKLLTDLKTGTFYAKEHALQLSAYLKARPDIEDYVGGLVINIHRATPEELKCYFFPKEELLEIYENVFLAAHRAWVYYSAPQWWKDQFINKEAA